MVQDGRILRLISVGIIIGFEDEIELLMFDM